MAEQMTVSASTTIFIEDGEQVYPCRCGETHRGDYGLYDHAHHNCFHDADLVDIGSPDIDGYLMCPECGKVFNVEAREQA